MRDVVAQGRGTYLRLAPILRGIEMDLALHEASHCVAAQQLGIAVVFAEVYRGGGTTWHRKPADHATAAQISLAAGVVNLMLSDGPQIARLSDVLVELSGADQANAWGAARAAVGGDEAWQRQFLANCATQVSELFSDRAVWARMLLMAGHLRRRDGSTTVMFHNAPAPTRENWMSHGAGI